MRRILALLCALSFASPALATLPTGAKAPDFTTRGAIGGKVLTIHLADELKKGPVVLYFFPAAFTGGCNAEAHAFAEAIDDFHKAGATVIGMSADTVPVLADFSTQKCAGKFAVASAGPQVVQAYDVASTQNGKDGTARVGTNRTSYVIAPDGRIVLVHSENKPEDHITLTLAAVRKMQAAR